MSFTITDSDGNITKEIWSCTECIWRSTKKHCRSTEGGQLCGFCHSPCEKVKTITKSTGMSDFKYKELLTVLKEDASGVGDTTVTNIENHFESGDEFLESAEDAYTELDMSALTEVSGVGKASAKQIALTIADEQGWENGALFVL